MPSGAGFWLDPRKGHIHRVTTHNDWLLDSANQQEVGLHADYAQVLESLDPHREIDEIRMIGVISGLIRIRDYRDSVHVQFFAESSQVDDFLRAVVDAMPLVTHDRHQLLRIQNLYDDAGACIAVSDLDTKLATAEPVLVSREPIPENEMLRRKMELLLRKAGL